MGIEKARFRNPVIPDCKLELNIEASKIPWTEFGNIKVKLLLKVKKWLMLIWSATIVDRK